MIFRKLNTIGGSQRHALNMAVKLQEMGHEITLYAIIRGSGGFNDLIKKFRVVSLESHHAPVYESGNPLKQLRSFIANIRNENADARALAKLIDPKTEILNPHHDPVTYKAAYYFKKCIRDIPSVWTMNDLTTRRFLYLREAEVNPGWRASGIKRLCNWFADYYEIHTFIAAMDGISVLDDRDKEWTETYFGKESRVVRSAIEVAHFPYRKRTAPHADTATLLASAIFFPHRRFEDIIEALAILRDTKGLRFRLSIIGKYESKDRYYLKIRDLIHARGLDSQVHLLGEVSEADLLSHFRERDIFLFPSHLQSWGIAVFEAMACGMPVIVSRTAGAAEVLADGRNALIVEPKDPQAIADAIERLTRDSVLYENVSIEGRKFVEDHMSWDVSAKNLLDMFKDTQQRCAHI